MYDDIMDIFLVLSIIEGGLCGDFLLMLVATAAF